MPKGSPELTSARKAEIISACRKLYESKSFKDITLKEIGQQISLTRTSIYNYFETKEEIFLALLAEEYDLFVRDLDRLCKRGDRLSADELASELARALERRPLMLKLLSMNHYDMEINSRIECLVEFKSAYGASIDAVDRCLIRFCPELGEESRQKFLYAFFPSRVADRRNDFLPSFASERICSQILKSLSVSSRISSGFASAAAFRITIQNRPFAVSRP